MYTKRYFTYQIMYFITWRMILWSVFTGLLALGAYHHMGWKWVAIPWLPVSLIGTAVAFYVGFKNNQSYDRSWEARTAWGGIVNLSRSFAAAAGAYLTANIGENSADEQAVRWELRSLIYRHLAWLYALKHAMWQRTSWEHQDIASTRQRRYFQKKMEFPSFEEEARRVLPENEWEWVQHKRNPAAQLLERQSRHLAELKAKGWLNLFHQMELQKLITDLYNEQGKTERIKNTPLPRQYATSSALFILIFTFLLPFGMLHEFDKFGNNLIWLLLPFNIVVSWVFSLMEYTGDYSENPFEGLMNDVPIHQIVRNIEIDLRDMLGEKELPKKIESHIGVTF